MSDFLDTKKDEIRARLAELKDAVEEHARLKAALDALDGASRPPNDGWGGGASVPRRGRPREMAPERFWGIIEGARTPSGLHARLDALTVNELVGFELAWDRAMTAAYRWDLWGAAYVLAGGCGNDSFDYFRAYLISRGKAAYELGISDPDALAASNLDDGETWEDWMSPAMTIVEDRIGDYDFAVPPDADQRTTSGPAGEPWDEDDLPRRFPRMSARYG